MHRVRPHEGAAERICVAFNARMSSVAKPRQQPHPPTWVAATSPGAIEWAASRGLSILMDPHSAHLEIARKLALYHEGLEKAGFEGAGRDIPIGRLVAVAESDAEAEEVARRAARWK